MHLTIDLFLYLQHIQRFSKRLFIIEYIITLIRITFSLMKNLVSGRHHQQTLRPVS
jgi:hypothetical protein